MGRLINKEKIQWQTFKKTTWDRHKIKKTTQICVIWGLYNNFTLRMRKRKRLFFAGGVIDFKISLHIFGVFIADNKRLQTAITFHACSWFIYTRTHARTGTFIPRVNAFVIPHIKCSIDILNLYCMYVVLLYSSYYIVLI